MIKKFLSLLLILIFLTLESCGTIFKFRYINAPRTNKLDLGIVALDTIGMVLFVIPGVIAFSIDYMTGTLFLPNTTVTAHNLTSDNIQQILKEHNIDVSNEQLEVAKKLAFHS